MPLSRSVLTTNLVGGLGNQLFLVANLLATSRRNQIPAFLPRAEWSSSNESPRPTYWDSIFERLPDYGLQYTLRGDAARYERVVIPEKRPVSPVHIEPSANNRAVLYDMVGFFQSDRFFSDYPIMREAVPRRLHAIAQENLQRNYNKGSSSQSGHGDDDAGCHTVGIHVRRGDYTRMKDIFAQLDVAYYDHAVQQLLGGLLLRGPETSSRSARGGMGASSAPGVQLLIFCEEEMDAQLVCGHLRCKYEGLSVTHVHSSNESVPCGSDTMPREVLELLMLAHCDDVVMANSTFSWWGAYLNERPLHRVISPSRWFVQHPYPQSNYLYCDGWMLI